MATDAPNDRTILGAVLTRGRIYTAGDEALLAAVIQPGDIDRLVANGQIAGDWRTPPAASSAVPAVQATPPDRPSTPQPHAPQSTSKSTHARKRS